MERAWRKYAGCWRAQVVCTETGSVLYTSWPYSHEGDAKRAARDWLRDEQQRQDAAMDNATLFQQEGA